MTLTCLFSQPPSPRALDMLLSLPQGGREHAPSLGALCGPGLDRPEQPSHPCPHLASACEPPLWALSGMRAGATVLCGGPLKPSPQRTLAVEKAEHNPDREGSSRTHTASPDCRAEQRDRQRRSTGGLTQDCVWVPTSSLQRYTASVYRLLPFLFYRKLLNLVRDNISDATSSS